MRFPYRAIIIWLVLLVLWLTWTPTGLDAPRLVISLPTELRDLLGNILLFSPVAVVDVVRRISSRRTQISEPAAGALERGAVVATTLLVVVLSLLVELGQTQVPGRIVSPFDVILNTAGALLVAITTVLLLRRTERSARWLVGAVLGIAFTSVLVFLAGTGHTAVRLLSLSDWDRSEYSVISGSEVGGGSAYDGSVRSALICGGPRGAEVCAAPGARVEERELLTDAVMASQRVRLNATVESGSSAQEGPARIVSFSPGYGGRNATFAQTGRSLVLRLRTLAAGPNGTRVVFVLPDAVFEDGETEVDAAYSPGVVSIAARSERVSADVVYRWGHLSGWWFVSRNIRRRFTPKALLFAAVVAAAALSIPVGTMAGTLPGALAWRAPLALVAPPLILFSITWPLGGFTTLQESGFCAAFGILGLALARFENRLQASR